MRHLRFVLWIKVMEIHVWTYACTYELMHAYMQALNHTFMNVHMYACCLLAVGCYCGIVRTRPNLLETCVATIHSPRDWRRLDQSRRDWGTFVSLCSRSVFSRSLFGVFHCCLPISMFKFFSNFAWKSRNKQKVRVVRTPDSELRGSGLESPCYCFEAWAISFTPRCSSSLSYMNEYLATDSHYR